ncbi:MAG: class II fructose-bisphosphate aldolase [Candidatus Harrisonbacteria bacterium]|nr:class II fructose-bisphosphate aldolase [Candidatus Harrisonbacteria bacterium]
MQTLLSALKKASKEKRAVSHFNISDTYTLKAVFEAGRELSEEAGFKIPIILGLSEGERDAMGTGAAAAFVRSLRKEHDYPLFINADHTHSFERVKEAVAAGFDEILFDGGKLPFEENLLATKEVVRYVKLRDNKILIEGELGYIGSSSEVFDALPEGAQISLDSITTSAEAKKFVRETGIDLLAPAVGNVHGMFKNASNPKLDIERISEIKKATGSFLVLHGGSGIREEDFKAAIAHGMNMVHVSTELRRAWREGIEKGLVGKPDEVAPYKLMEEAVSGIKEVAKSKMRLFNGL